MTIDLLYTKVGRSVNLSCGGENQLILELNLLVLSLVHLNGWL